MTSAEEVGHRVPFSRDVLNVEAVLVKQGMETVESFAVDGGQFGEGGMVRIQGECVAPEIV